MLFYVTFSQNKFRLCDNEDSPSTKNRKLKLKVKLQREQIKNWDK